MYALRNSILPYNTQIMGMLGTLKNVSFGEKIFHFVLFCFILQFSGM
jgi:hypothetical protein